MLEGFKSSDREDQAAGRLELKLDQIRPSASTSASHDKTLVNPTASSIMKNTSNQCLNKRKKSGKKLATPRFDRWKQIS